MPTLKGDIERMETSAESEQRSVPSNTPPSGSVEFTEIDTHTYEERNKATTLPRRLRA
jgi:hypothetical protein